MSLGVQLVARIAMLSTLLAWQSCVGLSALIGSSNCACAIEPALGTGFDRVSSPLVRTDLRLQSSASCAATSCHGGPRPGVADALASGGAEYPLWFERDPHALSWRTFCSEASVAIMERLQIMRFGEIIDRAGYDNCLACHNTTKQFMDRRSVEHLREGVGCSSCHGPSERWRSTHYQMHWDAYRAVADGFVPAGNMLVRARMCASCHVGDRDRDMNHDIIAAGHPALHYEFATFHQRLPKHWRDSSAVNLERYEASQWLAGQFAALDASLVLLESRADRALPISQWPELAAYNCTACHQHLRIGNSYAAGQSSSGVAEFSHWNRVGVEELMRLRLAEGRSPGQDKRLVAALSNLTLAMESTHSSADKSKQAARETRLALDAWLTSPQGIVELNHFNADRLRAVAVSAGKQRLNLENWETASQFYLASVAARQSWPRLFVDGQPTTLHSSSQDLLSPLRSARGLRDALTFQMGTSSPQLPIGRFSADAPQTHLRAIEAIRPLEVPSFVPAP